jgi:hypothetical protein
VFLLLFSTCAVSLTAMDWEAFVAHSSRSDDGLILDALKQADLETSIQICQALGVRKDPSAEDILMWLLAGFSRSSGYKNEILLRVVMKSLFRSSQGDAALKDRLDANASFVDEIVNTIARFQDPQIKGEILRLLPRLPAANRLTALMETGAEVVRALQQDDGRLSPAENGLAYDYLATVREIGGADFMDQCLELARLSRDPILTEKARQVAAGIAGVSR